MNGFLSSVFYVNASTYFRNDRTELHACVIFAPGVQEGTVKESKICYDLEDVD